MIAVIFELEPSQGCSERYFELAANLRDQLQAIDGFISIERFESVSAPGRFLSLSFWRDEAAVAAWRNISDHRAAQSEGRASVLSNYRLRVAQVVRDYSAGQREQAPSDSRDMHG